jgi:hypothetical protein
MLLTEHPPKKKECDDKLYSSNEEELGKILSCSASDSVMKEARKSIIEDESS